MKWGRWFSTHVKSTFSLSCSKSCWVKHFTDHCKNAIYIFWCHHLFHAFSHRKGVKCFVVCGFVKNTFWQKTFILLFIIITIANFWHKPLSEKLNIKAAAATSMTKLANVVTSTTERQLLRQSVFDTFGLMYKKALFVYSSTIQTNKPQNIIFLRNFYRLCTKQVTLVPLTFLSIFLLNIVVISKVKNA